VALTLERGELVLGQWLEEAVGHLEFAAVGPELALDGLRRNCGQPRHGRLAAHNHNLLARRDTLDQARQVRLGGMYGDRRHSTTFELVK
jgi:hypothetical protein